MTTGFVLTPEQQKNPLVKCPTFARDRKALTSRREPGQAWDKRVFSGRGAALK